VLDDPPADLPGIDDEPAGIYVPADASGSEAAVGEQLDRLYTDCKTNGSHDLGRFDDPSVGGPVILCSHCKRFWRTAQE
jgi:hypothetical protein